MKSFIAATAAIISTVSAHSWVECTNHDNSELLGWMKGNSTLNPPVIIDPAMPWYSQYCKGWPRNKANPGNWIDESTNYVWNIAANSWNGGSFHPADTHACPPGQRTSTYQDNAPMTSAAPGDMIRLRFGGNGHTRGANAGGDSGPGNVTVYWKGKPEQEITDISEFTPANALQTSGFAENSFSYPADPNVKSPVQGLVDKGNWMELKLPTDIAPGRHMMVWVWAWGGANQWSTCFDVMVSGTANTQSKAASSAPVPVESVSAAAVSAPAAPAPAAPAPAAPAPAAPAPAAPAPAAPAPAAPAPAAPAPAAPAAPSPPAPAASHAWGKWWPTWNDKITKREHPRSFA